MGLDINPPVAPASIPRFIHISGIAKESCEMPCKNTAVSANIPAAATHCLVLLVYRDELPELGLLRSKLRASAKRAR